MNILITCPPMIKQIKRYDSILKNNNLDYYCPEFKQTLTEEELISLVPKYDGWIIGDDPANERVFKEGVKGKLKCAVKWGVGTDNVDFSICQKLNIPITNIPNVFGEEVSDIAIGYLLCLTRKLHTIHNGNINNKWLKPVGESLSGKKACVIGFGDIGKCLVRKLLSFNIDIWVSDPAYTKNKYGNIVGNYGHGYSNINESEKLQLLNKVNIDNLESCLENANYLFVCCSLNDKTFHLVNKEKIQKCKKGVKIINVSRGSIVNETDIIELLESKFIDSVGFDVFEEEPLTDINKLRNYPGNIFGSHNGSNTIEAVDNTSKIAIQTITEYLYS